ncbi:hypothetical protein [Paenibacillus sp. FSL R7-269]|nr:hypothetical protein [Paenibacillus sp. FSL R7-269]
MSDQTNEKKIESLNESVNKISARVIPPKNTQSQNNGSKGGK